MFKYQNCKKAIKKLVISICISSYTADLALAEDTKNWGFKHSAALEAWRITRGNKKIIVAIIDTGVDADHPDLKNNLWTNPREILNGIDDDENGLVDDIHGWSFTSNNSNLKDQHGHGTHIAGIIKSIAPEVRLMILKYYDVGKFSGDHLKNTVKAIEYAVKMNVDLINYSGGGQQKYPAEEAAIRLAESKGILFVAAAGNEKSNSDITRFYPANYDLANIVSVTAIDKNTQILKSSNYGQKTVDIAAPGKDIYSALPGGRHGHMTGTSQATAFVSGAAALIMSKYMTKQNYLMTIRSLLSTNKPEQHLRDKISSESQLNIYRSLAIEGSDISAFGQITTPLDDSMQNLFINSN